MKMAKTLLIMSKLGMEYQNNILVGDYDYGRIYRFKLNKERTDLNQKTLVADRMAQQNIVDNISAEGFKSVTALR
jgi:hypothetical protein